MKTISLYGGIYHEKILERLCGLFYKKHWFGVVILSVIGFVMAFCWSLRDYIKEGIKGKFKKEDEES